MHRSVLAVTVLALIACAKRDAATDTATPIDSSRIGATTQPAPGQATTPPQTATGGEVQHALVDPNTASAEQLTAAGVDAATAAAIVTGRPYADMVAFDRAVAAKMNSEQRKALYTRVWKPIDLNTAKGDEILLIPGVGPKMRHEFEEYRPYRNIEQFRREIGKYVDKAEVARLEQYVTVK